jgi:hypothetical protein
MGGAADGQGVRPHARCDHCFLAVAGDSRRLCRDITGAAAIVCAGWYPYLRQRIDSPEITNSRCYS